MTEVTREVRRATLRVVIPVLAVGISVGALLNACASGDAGSVAAQDRANGTVGAVALQDAFRSVAEIALPAVVQIDVEEVRRAESPDDEGTPWFDFFFGEPDGQAPDREFRSQGLGSGVIVRADGNRHFILTNDHVLGSAESITVTLNDGDEFDASIVGRDSRKDLALLEISSTRPLAVASLGDSDSLRVGDWVLAIGSPYGFQSTVTAGIVSALGRRGGPDGNISDFIQTDAAINRGNSGGALVNLRGEVIGINTWITSQTGGSVGLGFSIPINNVTRSIDDFIEIGAVRYGWLGVSIRSLTPEVADDLGLDSRRGALVHHVFGGSPADVGGLLPGDVVRRINGVEIDDSDALVLEVGELPVDEAAEFVVIRDGAELTVIVTIAERDSERAIAEANSRLWPGFSVVLLTDDRRQAFEIPENQNGLLVASVESRTRAATAGVRAGDLLLEIDGEAVTTIAAFYRLVNAAEDEMTVTLFRDGATREIGVAR